MKINTVKTLLVTVFLGFGLSACKSDMSAQSPSTGEGSSGCAATASCIGIPIAPDFDGKIGSGSYAGLQVFRVDVNTQELIVTIPTPLPMGKPIRKDINSDKIEGGYWELKTYEPNKWAFEIHLPLKNFVKGNFTDVTPAQLPNGMALPRVPAGELPGFAVKWDNEDDKEFFLYLGGGVFALFVPTYNFDPWLMIEVPIKDKSKQEVGYFYTIPETEAYYGGFYIAGKLPDNLSAWVDDNLQ